MITRKEATLKTSHYILSSALPVVVSGSHLFVKATGLPGAALHFQWGKA